MNSRASKKYRIASRHRFAELYAFAMQYWEWRDRIAESLGTKAILLDDMPHGTDVGDPTGNIAVLREAEIANVRMVDSCARECSPDPHIQRAVHKAVTTPGCTFNWLKAHNYCYCERDAFYLARTKFYWFLDKRKK